MRRRVRDSILDRSYCPKCGKGVLDLLYEIHVLRCKSNKSLDLPLSRFSEEEDEYEPSYSFPSVGLRNDDEEEWTSYNYSRDRRCPKCDEEISESTYDFHTALCRGKYKRCTDCGEEYAEDSYYLHALSCKKKYEPSYSFPSVGLRNDDEEEWTSYNYQLGKTSSNPILDRALEHDLKMFGSSDVVHLYEKPVDYSCSSLTTVPLKLTEYTGELALSTSLERQLSRTIGDVSLPSFGESLVENAVSGIPSAGIGFIYGKPTSARDELGLAGLAGLATLVMGGPVAALTVVGFGFVKSILRWIFG